MAATAAQRARFERRVQRIIQKTRRLEDQAATEVARFMRDLRDRVDAQIARTDFDAFSLDRTRRGLNAVADEFADQFAGRLGELEDDVLAMQAEFRQDLADEAEVDLPGLVLTRDQLLLAQDFRADLIQNLRREVVDDISAQLQLGAIGQESPAEIQRRVARILAPRKQGGARTGAMARAEVITRNEINRIQNIAAEAADQRDAEFLTSRGETVRKAWLDADDDRTRPAHAQAAIDYGLDGDPGPIPVDAPFIVGGEPLMYPQDPSGSAGNTIQCRCKKVLVTGALLDLIA